MKKIIIYFLIYFLNVIIIKTAYSWSLHYLVSDKALNHPSMAYTSKKVKVEPLESFLESEENGIAKLFEVFYNTLKKRKSKRFKRMKFNTNKPSRLAF